MGDFGAIVTFLVLVYIRPQEWVSGFESLRPVRLAMIWALLAMVARVRPRAIEWRDLLRTPHDYVMWLFFLWVAFATPPMWGTFNANRALLVFYLATVNILTDYRRIETFLWWWIAMILVVSALGVGVEYGFDPTHAKDIMDYQMKGRLVLGMSIFNNPNALGHAIAPLAPMLYYIMVWRRPFTCRVLAFALLPLPAFCVYLTESKGAYISSAFALAGGLIFGRPKIVQIIMVILAVNVGGTLLYSLPRMGVMRSGKASAAEGGIAGRIFAFRYAWDVYQRGGRGLGKDRFLPSIQSERKWRKSAHSAFVEIGAELGPTGLFLYLSILYMSIKTLCLARCGSVQEERIRRAMMGALLAFCMSGWLVTFTYRAHFFFQAGIVAAFHRLLLRKGRGEEDPAVARDGVQTMIGYCEPPSPTPLYCAPRKSRFAKRSSYATMVTDVPAVSPGVRKDWNRVGVFDVVVMLAVHKAVLMFWWWIITHI
ncbi:MAG: O-antigen ligase family protein [Victivallales bacterium]|nr:O-antigen ligase family protein [Victivallales bacterium]